MSFQLPELDDKDIEILRETLSAAVSYYVRQELDAESEDDRKYYLDQEKEVHGLEEKLLGIPTGRQSDVNCDTARPQKEKKLRPFKDSREFILLTGLDVGTACYFRSKTTGSNIKGAAKVIISGLVDFIDNTTCVYIGCRSYFLGDLAENYEYYPNSSLGWRPFGVYE